MNAAPKDRPPKKVKLQLTFRCVEYHTIEREMTRKEFDKLGNPPISKRMALDKEFRDVLMPDVDIETISWELEDWVIVK